MFALENGQTSEAWEIFLKKFSGTLSTTTMQQNKKKLIKRGQNSSATYSR